MISSSNFFKKTFFTVEPVEKGKRASNEPYGPWSEEAGQALLPKRRGKGSKDRYMPPEYATLDRENEEGRPNRTELSKSLLLSSEHALLDGISRGRSLREKKNKINQERAGQQQTRLPAIKINESQNESLRRSILRLEGGLLNFITNNNQRSLKRFVSKREEPGPKFQMYKKCLAAARRMMQEGQRSSFFYSDS